MLQTSVERKDESRHALDGMHTVLTVITARASGTVTPGGKSTDTSTTVLTWTHILASGTPVTVRTTCIVKQAHIHYVTIMIGFNFEYIDVDLDSKTRPLRPK